MQNANQGEAADLDGSRLSIAIVQARFNADVLEHYGFLDREQGYILIRDAGGQMVQAPLMTLAVTQRPA